MNFQIIDPDFHRVLCASRHACRRPASRPISLSSSLPNKTCTISQRQCSSGFQQVVDDAARRIGRFAANENEVLKTGKGEGWASLGCRRDVMPAQRLLNVDGVHDCVDARFVKNQHFFVQQDHSKEKRCFEGSVFFLSTIQRHANGCAFIRAWQAVATPHRDRGWPERHQLPVSAFGR